MSETPLVTTDWLAAHLLDADLRVVDASWYLPAMNRDANAEFLAGHIPGAVRFDPDAIADISSGLPHMVAAPDIFSEAVSRMGISASDRIVVYDGMGLFSAARAWWNFFIMGATKVSVLDGGLPKWVAEGRRLAQGEAHTARANFRASFNSKLVAGSADVLTALGNRDAQVVDVRPSGRFSGTVPEPRPGLRSGHMPGAFNIPFSELVAEGRLKPPAELQALLHEAGIDTAQPIISSCGSGITAPLLNLALARLGLMEMRVYDGSWAEWGGRADLPVVSGVQPV